MGLSKGQKERRYGKNTRAETEQSPQKRTPAPPSSARYAREQLTTKPEKDGSYIFAGVALVITTFLLIYYYLWILPEFSAQAKTTIPELMFWFNTDHILMVQHGLGQENVVHYQLVHRSTGLVLPLIFAAAWVGMISGSKYPVITSRLMKLVPVLFALVFIAGGFMLDIVIANPNGPVELTALLIAARWLLLAGCLLQLIFMALRLIRSKINAFARGELAGQQKLR